MENDSVVRNSNVSLAELNRREVLRHLPILLVVLLLLVVGIIGNLLVLVVYKFKLRRSSARVYIISLALADLLVCVMGVPYHTLDNIWVLNYTQGTVCRTLSFVMTAASFCSVFVLLVVGLDRFLKVCRPLKRQIKDFGDRRACLIAMVAGIFVALPVIILYGNASYVTEFGFMEVNCFVDDSHRGSTFAVIYLSVYIMIFIVSVLFLIIIYGFICRKIYEHDRMQGEIVIGKRRGFCSCTSGTSDEGDEELNEDQDNEQYDNNGIEMKNINTTEKDKSISDKESAAMLEPKSKSNKSKGGGKRVLTQISSSSMMRHAAGKKQENTRKITLMMFTITVVFIFAYLPVIILTVLDSMTDFWHDLGDPVTLLFDFLLRLYLINNVANPIIYCFWDKRFRKECVHVVWRVLCCRGGGGDSKNSSSSNSSSHTHYTVAS